MLHFYPPFFLSLKFIPVSARLLIFQNCSQSEGILQVGQTPLSHSELFVPEDENTENCLIGFGVPHPGQFTPSLVAPSLWSSSNFLPHSWHLYS
jgi:hypothetical protein